MTDRYEELREALAKATPGPWTQEPDDGISKCGDLVLHGKKVVAWGHSDMPFQQQRANCRYIAAANPQIIAELLRERDEMERNWRDEIALRVKDCDGCNERFDKLSVERDALREEVASMSNKLDKLSCGLPQFHGVPDEFDPESWKCNCPKSISADLWHGF